jgi:DNA-binding NarL/FixJ family response regulator
VDDRAGMRVLIVDDQLMFAEAIRSVLEARGVEVVGIAETAADAVRIANRTRPDVVVVDMEMPDWGGLRAGREIIKAIPDVKVIGLVSTPDPEALRQAFSLGFRGCLTSDADALQLMTAIRAVAGGDRVKPSHLPRPVVSGWADDPQTDVLVNLLTSREREVLRMIASAANSEEIARRLAISVNTVRSHIQSIFTKLQVHSRLEAAAFAARTGLLRTPASLSPLWALPGEATLGLEEGTESSTA